MRLGYHAGFFFASGGDGIGGQGELLYSLKGAKDDNTDMTLNLPYISLPLLLRFGSGGFAGYLGPQGGFLLGASQTRDGDKTTFDDYDDFYNTIDVSGVLGVEYTLDMGLKFGGRGQLGIMKLDKEREILGETVQWDRKHMVFQFYVGFDFGDSGGGGGYGRY